MKKRSVASVVFAGPSPGDPRHGHTREVDAGQVEVEAGVQRPAEGGQRAGRPLDSARDAFDEDAAGTWACGNDGPSGCRSACQELDHLAVEMNIEPWLQLLRPLSVATSWTEAVRVS